VLRQAEALDPEEPDAHYRLARSYIASGQKDRAKQEFAVVKSLHAKKDETLIQQIPGSAAPTSER
jgi:cytochrome c-type biogenesis protein CcmH/NrfG